MNRPGAWHVVRHVVCVCGRVLDERGTPLDGVTVTLWSVPEADDLHLGKRRARQAEDVVCTLRDRTKTRPDGVFFFLDCSSGGYTAKALAGGSRACGVTHFRLPARGEGKAEMTVVDITVSPADAVATH